MTKRLHVGLGRAPGQRDPDRLTGERRRDPSRPARGCARPCPSCTPIRPRPACPRGRARSPASRPARRAGPGRRCWAGAARRRRRGRRRGAMAARSIASRSGARRAAAAGSASRAAAAKPAIAGRAGVPPRRPRSCPPPAISGANGRSEASSSAPAPIGPPSLCDERARLSAPIAAEIERQPPGRLHRIDVQQRAVPAAERGGLGDRLDRAGLVVGRHQADQRRRAGREQRRQGFEVRDALAIDRQQRRRRGRRRAPRRARSRPRSGGGRRRSAAMASASASVAPEVNTTPPGLAPKRAAIASRASSRTRRAARPAA